MPHGHGHGYGSAQAEWQDFLRGTHPLLQKGSPLRFVPSNPRCKLCRAPFGAPGRFILRRYGFTPWSKNPNLCSRCFVSLNGQAALCPPAEEDGDVRGAEVEASMLFADVRGSSKLARQIPTMEFSRLMNRFYRLSREVLIEHDAVIEKFVGDQIVGLFVPFLAGSDHARKAMAAARELFRATGHEDADGPWVPLGAGVHTGSAFVGMVGDHESSDFTALGDPVNIAAHLASQAGIGEILLTEAVREGAGLSADGLERRHVSLKGHPFDALVLPTLRVGTTTG
ncbi:MAG TPA: adenylate/guanylate cyclase domain-containing protein [Actinomycetota bacterium]|jgi:adenylate cyclase